MKRVILPVLMITLLLTACGSGAAAEERLKARRGALEDAERITFTADMTADLDGEIFACTLACAATPERVEMEVLSPDIVAGVKASMSAGEATLEYGGVQLAVGGPDTFGPFAALPLLCGALKTGRVVRAWTEDSLLAAEIYAGDDYGLTVWFDADTLTPTHAEISENGAVIVNCEIRDFTYE